MVGHYHPPCPQPDLTSGITSQTNPGVLTLLLQDYIRGLQVNGDEWVEVNPVPGVLAINIGDALTGKTFSRGKICSTQKYLSLFMFFRFYPMMNTKA